MESRRLDCIRTIIGDLDFMPQKFEQPRKTVRSIDVVINDEHSALLRARLRLLRCMSSLRGRRLCQRKPNDELASSTRSIAMSRDASAMHLDQSPNEGKPNTEPAF